MRKRESFTVALVVQEGTTCVPRKTFETSDVQRKSKIKDIYPSVMGLLTFRPLKIQASVDRFANI